MRIAIYMRRRWLVSWSVVSSLLLLLLIVVALLLFAHRFRSSRCAFNALYRCSGCVP